MTKCHDTSAPPGTDLNGIAGSKGNKRLFTRLLPVLALILFTLAPFAQTKAQTITIYNDTGVALYLNPFYAASCAPPWTQGTACFPVAANSSTTWTPPSGVWYGFKIYCDFGCPGSPAGSVSCGGSGRPFDCGGPTYYTGVDGNEVRIYEL